MDTWQLILNGLSLAGNLASGVSLISGISLDRDVKKIQTSLSNIEKKLSDYNKLLDDYGRKDVLENYLQNISSLKSNNGYSSSQMLELLTKLDYTNHNIDVHSRLIQELFKNISNIEKSYSFSQSQKQSVNGNLLNSLISDPFDAGVSEFWDISSVRHPEYYPNKIITKANTPIIWTNPFSNRVFLGEIHNSKLKNYGINFNIPHYQYNEGGYVYHSDKGLYLPTFFK